MTSTVPSNQSLGKQLIAEMPQIRTNVGPGFQAVAASAPTEAGNINVQREVSATKSLTAPMQYQFAEDRLTNMVGSNSRFMQEARRSGLEQAAARGAGNSSIAAGAAMREALRAAAPIAQQDAGFTQTEFGRGMAAQYEDELAGNSLIRGMDKSLFDLRGQNALSQNELLRGIAMENARAGIADARERASMARQNEMANADTIREAIRMQTDFKFRNQLAENDTFRQNWLGEQSSFRNMMEQTYQTELGLNAGMLDRLGQAFMDDPEVFNPQVVDGMRNFFQGQARGVINQTIASVIGDRIGTATPQVPATQPVTQPVRFPDI